MKRTSILILALALLVPSTAIASITDYTDITGDHVQESIDLLSEAEALDYPSEFTEALVSHGAQTLVRLDGLGTLSDPCWEQDRQRFIDYVWAEMGLFGYFYYVQVGSNGEPVDGDGWDSLYQLYETTGNDWREFDVSECLIAALNEPLTAPVEPDTGLSVSEFQSEALDRGSKQYTQGLDKGANYVVGLKNMRKRVESDLRWARGVEPQACYASTYRKYVNLLKQERKTINALLRNYNRNGSMGEWNRLNNRLTTQYQRLADLLTSDFADRC